MPCREHLKLASAYSRQMLIDSINTADIDALKFWRTQCLSEIRAKLAEG